MGYFSTAGFLGAAILVIGATALLKRWNTKYGWSVWLCQFVGQTAGDWIMRLGFIGALAVVAGVLQRIGLALPPEVEQWIPDQFAAIIGGGISAVTYWLAPTKTPTGSG